jgi:serine/threonine-protein kinase
LAFLYLYARRYRRARHHLLQAISMDPTAEETYRILGLVFALEGQPAEAQRVLREAMAMPGAGTYTAATLGYALTRAGETEAARAVLADLEARARSGYVSPVAFATLHIGLGETDRALDWLERSRDERRGYMAYLRVNPVLDPLRGHPRFEHLAQVMALAGPSV